MYYPSFTVVLLALAGLICYKVVTSIRIKHRHAREASLKGCLSPPNAPDRGLFGINLLRESVRATREEWGPIWMHQALNGVGKHVHTIRAPILNDQLLITRDTENVKAMFATQSQDFDIGPHREKCFKSLLGQGVMTGRGEMWKHSRALIRPQFARDNVADLALFQRHCEALLECLPVGSDGGWTTDLDLSPLFYNLSLDVSTEFLFGQSVHSQRPATRASLALSGDKRAPDLSSFGHHLDEAKHTIDRRGALAKFGWLLRDNAFPGHCKAVQEFVDCFVSQRLSMTKRSGDDEKDIETPTTTGNSKAKFVLLDELAKETQNPTELRNELLNVLHASRDTTAALLGWIFYFLARHPFIFTHLRSQIVKAFGTDPHTEIKFVLLDELAKETQNPTELRNELLNVLHASRDTTAALLGWIFYFLARHPFIFTHLRSQIVKAFGTDPHTEIKFQTLWNIPYLQHVLNETIRMVGIVPMNERAAVCDTTLPRGGGVDGNSPVFVPKGTQVLVPTYSMQHREDIWGADVEEFKPERWEGRKFGWDFIPFGGGARQCLGRKFTFFSPRLSLRSLVFPLLLLPWIASPLFPHSLIYVHFSDARFPIAKDTNP